MTKIIYTHIRTFVDESGAWKMWFNEKDIMAIKRLDKEEERVARNRKRK